LRWWHLIIVAACLLGGSGCGDSSRADPGCDLPQLEVGDPFGATATNTAGSEPFVLKISGSGFLTGCGDDGGPQPLSGVRLFVTQRDNKVSVAQVNASGQQGTFAVEVGVPLEMTSGSAMVVAQGADLSDASPLATEPVMLP
jgi:hypothetical protein